MKTLKLEEMTWPDIQEALDAGYLRVIVPVASIEQHGYHLPENTDAVLGEAGALLVAQKLGSTLVAPSIRPGISPHHMALPGSLTLRMETFQMVLEDYVTGYLRHGFQEIVFLASHGGNVKPCQKVAAAMMEAHPEIRILAVADVPSQEELRALEKAQNLPVGTNGGHADERETSEMLSLVPELVQMERATKGFCDPLSPALLDKFFEEGVTSLTNVGCIGDPCPATAQAGIWYREQAADQICQRIRTWSKLSS
jgi:creatinine amidohydrolase/Fe(II)-dependent formamide hydrolase-like protein